MMYSEFIGKRVRVKNCIKPCYSDSYRDVVGNCTFFGPNKELGWDLQITVDRTPLKINNINQVSLEPEQTSLFK